MKFLTPAIAVFGLCAVLSAQAPSQTAGRSGQGPSTPTQSASRSGQAPSTPTQSASRSGQADAVFKNVQVLKGIPVDQFLGTMGLFAAALSYDCSGCHTGAGTEDPKWEDDTPRKLTARRMIAMVQAINRDNFNGRQQVTCWTCHRGSTRPLVTPTLDRM